MRALSFSALFGIVVFSSSIGCSFRLEPEPNQPPGSNPTWSKPTPSDDTSNASPSTPSKSSPKPAPKPEPKPDAIATKVASECSTDADCGAGRCVNKLCVFGPSCEGVSHGGSTCGPNGDESCCGAIPMPVRGKRIALDKYNITAGRMRAFLNATQGDVKRFITTSKPANWDEAWTAFLPSGYEGDYNVWDQMGPAPLYEQVSSGSRTMGCYLRGGGARTYWVPSEVSEAYGDVAQSYPQDALDEKTLNCTSALMYAAFCAWDGGRLPSPEEIDEAWGPTEFPWGNAPEPWNPMYAPDGERDYANHANNYESPKTIGTDASSFVAPPGRFPKGNGRFGHADLVGNMWNITSKKYANGPYTRDPLGQWLEWTRGGSWEPGQPVPFENFGIQGEPGQYVRFRAPAMRKYWAGGARCAHPL
jgi:Sulfatase-modifying factor enzyme 1